VQQQPLPNLACSGPHGRKVEGEMQPKEVPDTNPWMFHVWHTAHHVSTTENAKSSVDHPQNSGLEGLFFLKKKQNNNNNNHNHSHNHNHNHNLLLCMVAWCFSMDISMDISMTSPVRSTAPWLQRFPTATSGTAAYSNGLILSGMGCWNP